MSNIVYVIEIKNWEKYNSKKKKTHESILLSCRFFDDAKVMLLSANAKLIFIRCLTVAGDLTTSRFEVHQKTIATSCGVQPQFIESSLVSLQQNQLLTYEKKPLLYNIRERKRKETASVAAVKVTSSSEKVNNYFNSEFQSMLISLKALDLSDALKRYPTELIERFTTAANLDTFLNDMLLMCKQKNISAVKEKRYILKAIKDEIGVSGERSSFKE